MIRRLIVRPEAEAELLDAAQRYQRQREGLGVEFLSALDLTFDAIRQRPTWFPFAHADVRRALVKRFPYAVYFLLDSRKVTVVAIRHTARRNRDLEERA